MPSRSVRPFPDKAKAAMYLGGTTGFLGGLTGITLLSWTGHREMSPEVGLPLVAVVAASAVIHQYALRKLTSEDAPPDGNNKRGALRSPGFSAIVKGADPSTIAAAARQVGLPAAPVLLGLGGILALFVVALLGLLLNHG